MHNSKQTFSPASMSSFLLSGLKTCWLAINTLERLRLSQTVGVSGKITTNIVGATFAQQGDHVPLWDEHCGTLCVGFFFRCCRIENRGYFKMVRKVDCFDILLTEGIE